MKVRRLYQCETCGTEYDDEKKAYECENTHLAIKEVYDASFHSKCAYPDRIEVVFSDGAKIWYKK